MRTIKSKLFTPEMISFMCNGYKELSRSALHLAVNEQFGTEFKESQIRSFLKNNGIKSGRTGCFEKGNIPHPNARPKGPNKTSFAKGNKPHNWKPVGSERVSKDGYLEVKTAEPRTWEFKHRLVYIEHFGAVPESHIVCFKDNDRLNCSPDNLVLTSRAESVVINRMQLGNVPAELKETVSHLARLKIAIHGKIKGDSNASS
jgi:hypothetical protein